MLSNVVISLLSLCASAVIAQNDDNLGLKNGYLNLTTKNFELKLVRDAGVLVSLKPAGNSFDFLPFDYLRYRARNGQYHWGDVTYRYREAGGNGGRWIDGDSAAARKSVGAAAGGGGQGGGGSALVTSVLTPTLPSGSPLNVTRQWTEVAGGDLGLRFTVRNQGRVAIELGSLGFPTEFNSIFTGRPAAEMARVCSLADPYIGMHAGHIRVAPTKGNGPALVVTPLTLGDGNNNSDTTTTPMEAYRNLREDYYDDKTAYGSQTFEGLYEWQVLTKAWAEKEWAGVKPWNAPSSRTLQPGEALEFGLRFSVAKEGVRELDSVVRSTGTPVAVGVPGYIISQGSSALLYLQSTSGVKSVVASPSEALTVTRQAEGRYAVTPIGSAWGRARLDIQYSDGKLQTVHYYITKRGTEAVSDLGRFSTTEQWFNDTSDPFGRAPSVMTYDNEAKAIVTQDPRAWVAGLSDEGGAGSFLAASMKQAVQPSAGEVAKLEAFVDGVLWKTLQNSDFSVRKSLFYYDPAKVPAPGFTYNPSFDWSVWWSWNKQAAYAIDRAYDYVHVAATYWALYRVARAYPALTRSHAWDFYLNQAYQTIMRSMKSDVGYNRVGLMGETVFGEILADLKREGQTAKVSSLEQSMRSRATQWNSEEVPFGSEMAWDSTGQEGVYYWTNYFGFKNTALKTVNSVLGFMPTVPHWGWNGNARRYWDNMYDLLVFSSPRLEKRVMSLTENYPYLISYGGKLQRIERQIHHYGSGLNSLVLLAAFRNNPSDAYLLRVGYGGVSGPLSSINADGFTSASFHSWPDTLKWDGYSGDYGPNFVGLALGSGTYVADMGGEIGLVAFGGSLNTTANTNRVAVVTGDPSRRRVFIGPLSVLLNVDAGIIREFSYEAGGSISVTLSQLDGVPKADAAVLWVETPSSSVKYTVTTPGLQQVRGGWKVPLSTDATVEISRA
ncbi:hypothetical protein PGQ11_002090 [Apiospora arundinis]|uniref:Glycoside hydrolase family 43 protein n=1 Tax=Apiospora arundinis TaxID=335852 RepID=A0ABR2JH41_9PEZI